MGGEVFLERNTSPPKPTSPKNFPQAPVPTWNGSLGKFFFYGMVFLVVRRERFDGIDDQQEAFS